MFRKVTKILIAFSITILILSGCSEYESSEELRHRPVQRRRLMEKYRLLQKFGHPTDGDRSGYFRPLPVQNTGCSAGI